MNSEEIIFAKEKAEKAINELKELQQQRITNLDKNGFILLMQKDKANVLISAASGMTMLRFYGTLVKSILEDMVSMAKEAGIDENFIRFKAIGLLQEIFNEATSDSSVSSASEVKITSVGNKTLN